jgi:hypothetical protein
MIVKAEGRRPAPPLLTTGLVGAELAPALVLILHPSVFSHQSDLKAANSRFFSEQTKWLN